jgi:hypothetical protein
VRPFRALALLVLGAFAGLFAAARVLRYALPSGARLSLHSLVGGIAIRIPPGWRVESNLRALAGGVAIDAPEPDDADAPRLTLDGLALVGGIAVGTKPPGP